MALSVNDPNSCANIESFITTKINLSLFVNFDSQILKGKATLSFKLVSKNTKNLLLDVNDLNIKKILLGGKELTYTITPYSNKELGSKLDITLPELAEIFDIEIHYETTPQCSAVQWMNAKQTQGGKHPYLYSQCEPILARTLLPCQDTPSIKAPYKAEITAPAELNVVMSAKKEKVTSCNKNHSVKIHHFDQPVPIPIYLLAIACGNIKGRSIGPRSTIWSEPEMLDAAASEFADTEHMLRAAEELCGPYVWGVYDLLVLPPSFPFGGMENPCLTFVTPTLIAGDKSLTSVVAHEIAHSWTGNLVTNTNWEHFWLNEGHTVYLERLIIEKLSSDSNLREMHIQLGLTGLQSAINTYGATHPFTKLIPPLTGENPDDAFSRVPYEKGSIFLYYLESLVGKDKMLKWLKKYLEEFEYKSLNSNMWKEFWLNNMENQGVDKQILSDIDFDAWFYNPGPIPVQPKVGHVLTAACEKLVEDWIANGSPQPPKEKELNRLKEAYHSFSPKQKEYFISKLSSTKPTISVQRLKILTDTYELDKTNNCELRMEWLQLAIDCRCVEYMDNCLNFLNSNGRMKYVRPLYRSLYDWKDMRQRTVDNFRENQASMHPLTAQMLSKDLHLTK